MSFIISGLKLLARGYELPKNCEFTINCIGKGETNLAQMKEAVNQSNNQRIQQLKVDGVVEVGPAVDKVIQTWNEQNMHL
jgi:hypothetical protein